MPSGRPLYEPNPASRAAGHGYDIERLKRRQAPPPNGVNPRFVFGGFYGTDPDAHTPNWGSGDWTIEDDGSGGALITIDPPFATPPAVTVTAGKGGDHVNGVPIVNADSDGDEFTDHFTIEIQDPATGDPVAIDNNGWYFTAVALDSGVDPADDDG